MPFVPVLVLPKSCLCILHTEFCPRFDDPRRRTEAKAHLPLPVTILKEAVMAYCKVNTQRSRTYETSLTSVRKPLELYCSMLTDLVIEVMALREG